MARKLTTSALAKLIRQNPGAVVQLDNDWWALVVEDEDGADVQLATSNDVGYSLPYGQDILHALALIANIEIEAV